jgi:hypothetical protein
MKPWAFNFTAEKNRGFIYLLFLLSVLLLPVRSVLAHGGGTLQVANAAIATYRVSVWTNPPTVRANQPLHLTVSIATAVTGEPVLDAAVNVVLLAESGDVVVTAVATTEQSINRLFYEADLLGAPAGNYEVQVEIVGQEGDGDLSFPLRVESRSIGSWGAGILLGASTVGAAFYLWRKKRRRTLAGTAVPHPRSID